jgi:DNA-binding beta-propeller fold protein YncE
MLNGVAVLRGDTLAQTALLPAPSNERVTDVAVDPSNGRVYVATGWARQIDIYEADNRKVASVPTPVRPNRVAVNPLNHLVYYTELGYCPESCPDSYVHSFTYGQPGPHGNVVTGTSAAAVAFNPASNRAYATMPGGSALSIIDSVAGVEMDNLALAGATSSTELAVNPVTSRVYVAVSGAISVVEERNPVDPNG